MKYKLHKNYNKNKYNVMIIIIILHTTYTLHTHSTKIYYISYFYIFKSKYSFFKHQNFFHRQPVTLSPQISALFRIFHTVFKPIVNTDIHIHIQTNTYTHLNKI